jgi:hypothetical protein
MILAMRRTLCGLVVAALLLAPVTARADRARAQRAAAIAMWIAGGLATVVGVALYTQIGRLEAQAHNDLALVRDANPASDYQYRSFYASPTCSLPAGLVGPQADTYRRDCTTGENVANAGTAMFVLGPTLGAAGMVAYLTSRGARRAERPRVPAPTVEASAGGLRVRF